jgi:hypothetical protein
MPELGNIDQFISEVEAISDGCQQQTEKVSDLTNDLDKCEKDLEKAIGEIREDATKFDGEFTTDHEESCTELEKFIALLEKLADEGIGEFLKTFTEIGNATERDCEQFESELDSEFNDLDNNGFKEVDQGIDDCEKLVTEQENETKQSFDQYESHCEEQESLTSQFAQATMGIFGSVSENMSDTLSEAVSSGMDFFTTGLTTGLSNMEKGLGETWSFLEEGFNLFNSGADTLGNSLADAGMQILGNAMSNITDRLMEEMSALFTRLCEEVFQALLGEFTEQLVTMGIGQAITTATAPYAPVIIAANLVLGIIEKLLSVFGM